MINYRIYIADKLAMRGCKLRSTDCYRFSTRLMESRSKSKKGTKDGVGVGRYGEVMIYI